MKAVVFTLGCKVNGVESASLLRGLEEMGFEVSDELEYADLYILNTCAVTGEAEKKSRQAIARVRAMNPQAHIIVCGCAAEKTPEVFAQRSGVEFVAGARQKSRVLEIIKSYKQNRSFKSIEENVRGEVKIDDSDLAYDEMLPPRSFKSRAFIKIQDGCNNFCSYCIIPYLRGRSRSRSLESAVREILTCEAEEAVVTGIDLSSFCDGGRGLADLLTEVRGAPCRIRLGSLEVGAITPSLLEAAKQVFDFAPHFHLSLQSGSDAVLKKMNRHYTREEYAKKVSLIREYFPDAAITTDIIVGFPTETEQDFSDTLELAERVRFSQIHCFAYSRRTGTNAAKLKDSPAQTKKERLHRLMCVAEKLRQEYEQQFIGKELELVPEEEKEGFTVGYSQNYIRLYVAGKVDKRGKVRAVRPYADGLLAEREE